jgi:hypothetical protein
MRRNTDIGAMSALCVHVCVWACRICTVKWAMMFDAMIFVPLALVRIAKTYSEHERGF